jgi:serine-type D-Ala-D-Ala carboxypeptidase (penicillin-binding protein 5/6)
MPALLAVGLAAVAMPAVTLVSAAGGKPAARRPVATASGGGSAVVTSATVVPGAQPVLNWPKVGQAAVAVSGVGLLGMTAAERPVPIASLTKMMTALVILHDHPLPTGSQGPVLVISPDDVTDYVSDIDNGDSALRVAVGERLTEFRLLQALLLPSADNIADLLASWDAGSLAGFVGRMNAMARILGLHSTRYADASGVNPGSVSTASDQAIVAAALMRSAVVRRIVRQRQSLFPVAGVVPNFNPAIGVDGIIGVKSGWTQAAQGCLVAAAYRSIGRSSVLVITVVLGERGGLRTAALIDEHLLDGATRSLVRVKVAASGETFEVRTPIGKVTLSAPRAAMRVVGWPGLELRDEVIDGANLATSSVSQIPVGSAVATLEVVAPWGTIAEEPLELVASPSTTTTIVPTSGGTTSTISGA